MGGIYSEIVAKLPTLPPEDPSYQEKLDELKRTLRAEATQTPESLAKEYSIARAAKDELSEDLYVINQRIAALEQMLTESQDSDEPGWGRYGAKPNALRLASGAVVRIDHEPYPKVEDKEAFRLWCLANGLEKSLQLWPASTAAITKERLLAGQSEPTGVVAYARAKVVFTKGEQLARRVVERRGSFEVGE
jgi:hypothetical protein